MWKPKDNDDLLQTLKEHFILTEASMETVNDDKVTDLEVKAEELRIRLSMYFNDDIVERAK